MFIILEGDLRENFLYQGLVKIPVNLVSGAEYNLINTTVIFRNREPVFDRCQCHVGSFL